MTAQETLAEIVHKFQVLGLTLTPEDLAAVSAFQERFAVQIRLLYEAPVDGEEPAHLTVPR